MKGLAEKYVTKRLAKDGRERWYWQKKGFPLCRLPDDPVARAAMATQLNMNNDATPKVFPRFGYWYDFWLAAKRRAQSRRVPFTLSYDDFHALVLAAKGKCAISGAKFRTEGEGRVGIGNPFQPSIDRIDPTQGYVKGNCRLVCLAINVGVNKWGEQVYRELARLTTFSAAR